MVGIGFWVEFYTVYSTLWNPTLGYSYFV